MLTDDLNRLLELYRARLLITRKIQSQLERISALEPAATILERQKWDVRVGQEVAMIERLEKRLGKDKIS